MSEHNPICLSLPAVVAADYKTEGSNEMMGDLDVYVTSPPNPTIGIITIYDIFGMASQTLQGADILSSALNAVVLVPDFFKGESVKSEWMTGGDAGKQLRAKFMAEKAEFPGNVAALLKTVEVAKKKFPYVTAWGTYGLCWGGKVVAMASGANTPFKATGQVHAGRLTKEDAQAITVPHINLASKDEDAEAVAVYKQVIESNGIGGLVETYSTMHHGWCGAKAKLDDEENLKEYKRAYGQLAEFFQKHL